MKPYIVAAILWFAHTAGVSANTWSNGIMMCETYGEFISCGGDCCTVDSVAVGWKKGLPCTVSKSRTVNCESIFNFSTFKKQWQGLGTCRIYTIVCEPPAKPALLVGKDGKYKVYKECNRKGAEAIGITINSVGDDQCACGVNERRTNFKSLANGTAAHF